MDEQKQSLIDRIKQAQNILVTVSTNPSVDQLAAAIGLTIALNKLDKHGTAVFSGEPPSTIEFLKPEETLEKNTDSLRDFIIALDKSKADKLRYKVEDQVVRIFITPYKTSLSQNDLDFSQGDFNVDVVVALGVKEQQDLDAAITSHGRILHDATVVSVSTESQGSLGTINWVDPSASSLSEMVAGLVDGLDKKAMDGQIATALLTGIVAMTDRFSNEKTSPKTMSASAALMAAGANQQLIASELEGPEPAPSDANPSQDNQAGGAGNAPEAVQKDPGMLEIDHEDDDDETEEPEEPEPAPEPPQPQIKVDENGMIRTIEAESLPEISQVRGVGNDGQATESGNTAPRRERLTEPPRMSDGGLTANTSPEDETEDLPTEELSLPPASGQPLLTHNANVLNSADDVPPTPVSLPPLPDMPPAPQPSAYTPPPFSPPPVAPPVPAPAPYTPPAQSFTPPPLPADDATLSEIEASVDSRHVRADSTLSEIEASVDSPHMQTSGNQQADDVDSARNAVEAALSGAPTGTDPLQPIAALNAQPLGAQLHDAPAPAVPNAVPNLGFSEPTPGNTPADDALDMPLPSSPFGPGQPSRPLGQPDQQAPTGQFQNPQVYPQQASAPAAPAPQSPPSSFPAPQQGMTLSGNSGTPPPPVPPPMLPPLR